jgi:hypothetical protein
VERPSFRRDTSIATEAGVVIRKLRTPHQFLSEAQYADVLAHKPLISIIKIAETDSQPFTPSPASPLEGIRALGLGHVIAGAGFGRGMALPGADVLNVWQPSDVEHDRLLTVRMWECARQQIP